nr:protein ACCELERATED CELL DEATH 6-like [Ziziphus jujuba var. spinosa]
MDSFRFPEAEITDDHDQYNLVQHHESHQIIIIDRDLHDAAKRGEFSAFTEHEDHLDHLLTPHKSTILHIHINSRSDHDIFKPISSFVEEILAMCPSLLKMSDARGDTPLHRAARKGDAPAVKALIKCRKNLEQDTERGVQGLRTEMLRTKNKKGDTALHEAVRFCHLDVAEILSEEDNDILCYGNEAGQTPLHLAIKRRHRPFVLQMLDKYRELQIPDCLIAMAELFCMKRSFPKMKTFEEAIDVTTSFTPETDKAIELTLVAATLIATVTFAAGFTLPGGYVSDKGPQQGSAVLKKIQHSRHLL